jgi:hypothetical protein
MTGDEFIQKWQDIEMPPQDSFSIWGVDRWRECRDTLSAYLADLSTVLRVEDEAELARIEERAAKLRASMGAKPAVLHSAGPAPTYPAPAKPHNPVSETDWGMGIGGREKPIDPAEFRQELADLRDRTTEKRARRGNA